MTRNPDRRTLMAGLSSGSLAALSAQPARAETPQQPEVTWRLISSFPKSLDLIYGGAERFAKTIGELTGGRFKIEVSPPTEAVGGLAVLDAVKAGTIEASQTSLDYFYGKDPSFALATGIPFGMNARQHYAFATQGAGNAQVDALLEPDNAMAFPAGNTGAQMGGFFKKDIRSAADLDGLKIRIGGLAGRVLQKLGAVPVATPRAEILGALQSGALDGVTWVSPHDDEIFTKDDGATGIQKLAPNYYYPGFWKGSAMVHIVVDRTKFQALPASYQAAIRVAAADGYADMLARYDTANSAALRRLVIAGAQLRPLPQDILDVAYKATTDVLREIGDGNARFKANLDTFLAFRNEAYLWWQVGEYTFDNFNIRQRAKG
ncbi:ABC transporter substrate-binding protein [Lichenihabitans sp. Uapishka_5]|uniref:TRAP transporter substrate-binding protein n=1 Tax=Lichenihabitans sp. Uapishka_5 TaxID=3037302 RepID=UPI0029E80E10|nr:ABC transporter substrate-binding protein [Lichenihabitans sp. Uapishka_5]MDX7949884.1 ABC transporter substrate-binding protein [Lichenihabitans sp. Uapishka_5]